MTKIREAFMHSLIQQYSKGQISFSRMVELINEKANEPTKQGKEVIDDKYEEAFQLLCCVLPCVNNGIQDEQLSENIREFLKQK